MKSFHRFRAGSLICLDTRENNILQIETVLSRLPALRNKSLIFYKTLFCVFNKYRAEMID